MVEDNGIGLPIDRDRLAEPYVTTRNRGTGLGLAIVKKIVEEHGGTMSFSDRDGGGTIIMLDFDTSLITALADDHDLSNRLETGDEQSSPEFSPSMVR